MNVASFYAKISTQMRGAGWTGTALRSILWKDQNGIPVSRFPSLRTLSLLSPQMVLGGLTPEQLDAHWDSILAPVKLSPVLVGEILKLDEEPLNNVFARLKESQLADIMPQLNETELNGLFPHLNDRQLGRALLFITDEQMRDFIIGCNNERARQYFSRLTIERREKLIENYECQTKLMPSMEEDEIAQLIPMMNDGVLRSVCSILEKDKLAKIIEILSDAQAIRLLLNIILESRISVISNRQLSTEKTQRLLGLIKDRDEALYYRIIFEMRKSG